jgi:hypothetical protein
MICVCNLTITFFQNPQLGILFQIHFPINFSLCSLMENLILQIPFVDEKYFVDQIEILKPSKIVF